jgi:hypothetical protein
MRRKPALLLQDAAECALLKSAWYIVSLKWEHIEN